MLIGSAVLTRLRIAVTVLTPDAIRLNVSSALASLPVGFLSIILPIYFSKLGLDSQLIGQLYMVSSITSAVLLVVFGFMADHFGRKWFVMLGTALPATSYVILLTSQDPTLLYIAAALGGVGLSNGISGALASSSFNALLAEKVDDSHRNAIFSLANASWTIALTVGSLLSGLPEWLQRGFGMSVIESYRPVFWFSLIAVVLGSLVLIPVREEHKLQPSARVIPSLKFTRPSLMATVNLSIFMGAIGLGLGFGVQMMPLWFYLKFGVSGDTLGPWYAAAELLSTLAMLIVPLMARRLGAVKFVLLTQGSSAFALIGMIFAPVTWIGALLMAIRGTLVNMSWPIQQSYTMGVVQPHERATVSSATMAAWGLASAVSPLISGIWFDRRQLELPLLAGAGCYFVSAIFLFVFFRDVRPPEESLADKPAEMIDLTAQK
jgi:MFS family permease